MTNQIAIVVCLCLDDASVSGYMYRHLNGGCKELNINSVKVQYTPHRLPPYEMGSIIVSCACISSPNSPSPPPPLSLFPPLSLPPSLFLPPSLPPLSLQGADSELRCKWTNMNALHYAVFFDVPEIVETLLEHKPGNN